ncbi:hypothetical protein ACJJTC_009242 [Scirpophaga incertulas]
MASLPPRKISGSSRSAKQDASHIQVLLQMGFPRHRALKALAATGNRGVQLASDWLLTHVNDVALDADEPREYIFYASPTGPMLQQLVEFFDKSKKQTGWNRAHNFPPHITLVSFFKAPDETSLQIAKAVKHVVEIVGNPPNCPLKVEPYISHNFMGLFVSCEHADYLKRIAVQYVKQVSSSSISLEPHVKSLHITLAYHFDVAAYDALKDLVDELQPVDEASWELRLYSRDPRFANHQVYKVTQGYEPRASDELELVLGDYIYIEEEELKSSPDGWVRGTSWLTGVNGYLPAVYTQRTAESDAWTLHRAMSLTNNGSSKSESDSNTDGELPSYPHDDAAALGLEKSEETFKEWENYWAHVRLNKTGGILNVTSGTDIDWKSNYAPKMDSSGLNKNKQRWVFAMRHGERVDLTYGHWVQHCFDASGRYVRKDLNLPLSLAARSGGKDSYALDTPLTRVGWFQAELVGEGLRLAGACVGRVYASTALRCVETAHALLKGSVICIFRSGGKDSYALDTPLPRVGWFQAELVGEGLRLAGACVGRVYASAALRCVETAHALLKGLQADPSVKVKVEPGLFEFKMWHLVKGMAPFMTPLELHTAGYNVDLDYKAQVELDVTTPRHWKSFMREIRK